MYVRIAIRLLHALERKTKSGVYRILALSGGIAPVARRRCPVVLVLDEREEISRGIAARRSIRRTAARLGRSPSTVSREIRRHGGRSSYRATVPMRIWERVLRPKPCGLASYWGRIRNHAGFGVRNRLRRRNAQLAGSMTLRTRATISSVAASLIRSTNRAEPDCTRAVRSKVRT